MLTLPGRVYEGWLHAASKRAEPPSLYKLESRGANEASKIFLMHSMCFLFLRLCVGERAFKRKDEFVRHLFGILYCTPRSASGILLPGHDYGMELPVEYMNRFDVRAIMAMTTRETAYIMYDPSKGETIEQEPPVFEDSTREIRLPYGEDPFVDFPNEAVMLVLEFLPSNSLVQLRLASRRIADVTIPSLLPKSFWASRFWMENEMAFVYATLPYPEKSADWKRLYFSARATLKNRVEAPNFANRARIWKNACEISQAMLLAISNNEEMEGPPPRYTADDVKVGAIISGDMLWEINENRTLQSGCRRVDIHQLFLPSSSEWPKYEIGVSFIYLNGRRYISGLRLIHKPNEDRDEMPVPWELCSAGLISHSSEQRISFKSAGGLYSIEVVAHSKGIVGLVFVLYNKNEGGWQFYNVGRTPKKQNGVGVARLFPAKGNALVGLSVGLDVGSHLLVLIWD
jgi:hypothetical protein